MDKLNTSGLRLSIIVPVYNVEPFVERCIRSLMDQDIDAHEYEVIIINDGSPDDSKTVIENLQQEFNNIFLINQENQGVSVARNNGIAKAEGKYILCVDPDDYIIPNSLRNVLKVADSLKLELLYLGFDILGLNGELEYTASFKSFKDTIFVGTEVYFKSRGKDIRDPDRSVGILYSSKFIKSNRLYYPKDVPYLEDGVFIAKVLCLVQKGGFHSGQFYQRTTRIGSATKSNLFYDEKAINGFINASINLRDFKEHQSLSNRQRLFLNQPICKFILLSLSPTCSIKHFSRFRSILKILNSLDFMSLDLKGCNNYYKIEGWLFNRSPYLFYLHRLLNAPILKLTQP